MVTAKVKRSRLGFRFVLLVSLSMLASCTPRVVYEPRDTARISGAVSINTATVAELEALPGIGRKTAEAIVEHREKNGPFRRVEHIMLVRGMSERRFLEIQHLITN
jgi:competence ComEA-like helix-hairpin-helix protein